MSRARKLGWAAVGLLTFSLVSVFCGWELVAVVCGFLSIVLGLLAGLQGSKGWFAVPASVLLFFSFFAWLASQAY